MEKEESIDLGRLWRIMLEQKKTMGGVVIAFTVSAFFIANMLPKEYSSSSVVQTRTASKIDVSGAQAVMATLGIATGGASSSTSNYIELMKTRAVLEPVIDSLDWENEDKKPSTGGFAKKNLVITSAKGSNIITIVGKGRTPEEAQKISAGVVENFLKLQTNNNQQTQSLLVNFLNERIETAKKEADESAEKLASFQRENKIFKPDDQAKLVMEELNAFDKSISELQVDQKSSQAQYDVATQKIAEQKAGARDYNINDNATVQDIRSQIVTREVELVGLRQKYTERHPDVIATKNQIKQLQESLTSEVSAIVNSNVASINSVQMSLLTDQAQAEAKLSAAKASEKAIRERKTEKEKEVEKLPSAMVTYLQLESDAKIKQEIYTSLVQQCEQDKIQEAMEAMDIQVIDKADLPKGPSGPRVNLITAVGFVLGMISALGYCFIRYKREI